jgi:histidinol phosphatase-like enzyme
VAEYARACDCRKPGRGLVDRAVRELGIDPGRSFAVGDRWLDVALAREVGAAGVLVRTGYGLTEEQRPLAGLAADAVVDNLAAAASWILQHRRAEL